MPDLLLPTKKKLRMPALEQEKDVTELRAAILGLGFIGLPIATTWADVGFCVTGIDTNPHVLTTLQSGRVHFEEPGLQMCIDRHLGSRFFVTDTLVAGAHDVYTIAVGTPVDPVTRRPMLDFVRDAAETVGRCLKKGDLVIMRSTVPVGATRLIVLPALERESGMKAGDDFDLVFAPERLVAGRAMEELRELPQIIGGYRGTRDLERASKIFKRMTGVIVEVESIEAAEMSKIIDNSYRDLTFGYANQMALLCERIGIDMVKLAKAVNFGYARNHVPVPSPGVGGTCLAKDPYILIDVGVRYGYVPELAKTARAINESMPPHVAAKMLSLLRSAGKDPAQSTVFILGFAFKGKPETSDTRDSPTLIVLDLLKRASVRILGFDPVVAKEKVESFGVAWRALAEGFAESDGVLLMTNHRAFEAMDIFRLLPTMRQPGAFLDGWHLFDPAEIKKIPGIVYGGVGND